ncbi:MAG: FAD-dependent oxidoreductase, partial [Pseudomonadota bacterium]
EARGAGNSIVQASPSVILIGAGIAGAATARALAAAGLAPIVIEATGQGSGASGFPAALVTPRFDLGDAAVAGLFAQALERADAIYSGLPGAVLSRGVLQLAGTDRDVGRFGRIAEQPIWDEGAIIRMDNAEASRVVGEPVEGTGLSMRPASIGPVKALLRRVDLAEARAVIDAARTNGEVSVRRALIDWLVTQTD